MRLGLFVDGSNMIYAQRHNGWRIDWMKVYDYLRSQGEITEAHYFSAAPHYQEPIRVKKYRAFCYNLIMIGYTVHDKEVKLFRDQRTGKVSRKGNLDIELALTMQAAADNFDRGFLFAGDGDYRMLVDCLRQRGKQVTCVCRRQMTSLDLINAANAFVELDSLRAVVEKS